MAFWDRKNKVSEENVKLILMVMEKVKEELLRVGLLPQGGVLFWYPFRACRCLAPAKSGPAVIFQF